MNNGSSPQRSRTRTPQARCAADGCKNPRAVTPDPRTKQIPLCLPHMCSAGDIERQSRRRAKVALYTRTAAEQGREPEEMFWDPEVFPSQQAQAMQKRFEDERDLEHYRSLVASGRIKGKSVTKTTPRDEQDGSVYYLRVGSYVKIGWSLDLAKRMRSYPPDSILLAVEPGSRKDEHRRHKMFAAHRTHGREWYAMTPSVMRHIDQVASKHGAPDPVTFAARPVEVPQPRPAEPVTPRGWTGRRAS